MSWPHTSARQMAWIWVRHCLLLLLTSSQRSLRRWHLAGQAISLSPGSIMWMSLSSYGLVGPTGWRTSWRPEHHFTTEMERGGHFPLLDIYGRPDGFWAVRYNVNLPILTSVWALVLVTTHLAPLVHRARGPCDYNSHSNQHIFRAFSPTRRVAVPSNKPDSVIFLPYLQLH